MRVSWMISVAAAGRVALAAQTTEFGVDLVFPQYDTTYNFTRELPVIFALNNVEDVVNDNNSLKLQWAIVSGGLEFADGGVVINSTNVKNFTNADRSPFLLVHGVDTDPYAEYDSGAWSNANFPRETPFSLQMTMTISGCESSFATSNFSTWAELPPDSGLSGPTNYTNPQDLDGVAHACPHPLYVGSGDGCAVRTMASTASATACAWTPDVAQVSSMSSVAAAQVMPSSSTAATPSTTSSSNAAAAVTVMPTAGPIMMGVTGAFLGLYLL